MFGMAIRFKALALARVLGVSILLLAAAQAHAKSITLNMKGADINAVITTVSEVTGKNFIVDPRVKGKVTIISAKPLDQKAVYQVFLAVLDVHGFTAVPTGDVIKIMPDADAKHSGTPSEGIGQEVVTQVIEAKHVAAAQLVPILRPLVPPQGHLAAHAQTNTLIISDRAANIQRLMKIIERIDQPSGGEIEIIQLEHASAAEVVRILTSLQQQERKKEPTSTAPTLVADERTNSILIGGEKADRLQLKTIITHLDTPSENTGDTHVIYLHYAQAKEMVPVLTGVGTTQAKDAKAKGAAAQGNGFTIQADENANALVITAPQEIYRSLEAVVRQLDMRRAQVLVEAVIADVSASKTAELGVQWVAGGTDGKSLTNKPVGLTNFGNNSIVSIGSAIANNTVPPIGNGLTMGLGFFDSYNFAAIVSALAADSSANVLSTPNLLTMDNEEAEIFVGKEVRIPTGSFSSTGSSASPANPFTTFTPKEVGIRLKVKPQINEGNAVKLDIEQSVDAITSGSAGEANLVTSQRKIKTSVIVDDGKAVVLGGLITDDGNETVQKVPLLGDIPLLGNLFRYKRTTKDKTNLMVFLRPTILRDAAVTTAVTNGKYSYMRAKELEAREHGTGLLRNEPSPVMPPFNEYLKPLVPPAAEPNKGAPPVPEQAPSAGNKSRKPDYTDDLFSN